MVTRIIAIVTVVACILGSFYGCVQKGSDYKSFVSSRANTDTVLTMEGMRIGQNLADSLNANSSNEVNEVAIKKLRKTFEIRNVDLQSSVIVGGTADVEYFVKLDSVGNIEYMWYDVDCNTATTSKSEMLTAIVDELNHKFGIFSYYEYKQQSFFRGNLSKKLTISADTTLVQIIQESQRDLELVGRDWDGGRASLKFLWKWKNQEITVNVNNYSNNKIDVLYSNFCFLF